MHGHAGKEARACARRFARCLARCWRARRRHGSAADEPPMVLAKTGYLFAGGKIDSSVPGSPMTGQMYVEYFIPKTLTHPYPIVMIHGGSQTGTNFTGTPDGREGWAQYFVRRGHAVYVVDQVARGRSAHFSQSQGRSPKATSKRTEQRFVAPERFNLWPQAKLHTQWPGGGKPGDPVFDAFYASQFPSLSSFPKQQEINRDAGIALLDKIGPAVLLIAFAVRHLHLADRRRAAESGQGDHRGRAERAAGATRPNSRARRNGSPTWARRRARGSARCRSPTIRRSRTAKSSPSCARTSPTRPISCAAGSRRSRRASCRISPAFRSLIVVSEASYHAAYDHCTANYLTQAGVRNTMIRLGDVGIRGNGHMMMLEKNCDDIARSDARVAVKAVPAKD